MNVLTITGIVVTLTLLLGAGLAFVASLASRAVKGAQAEQAQEQASLNPAITKGHRIPVDADIQTQLRTARQIAAAQAARMPRWANMRIRGRNEVVKAPSTFSGLEADPISAVKIAQFHTWTGVNHGPHVAQQPAAAAVAAPTAAPTRSPDDLKPGVDYPFIEITDDMPPAEVRKARIANAKARSAAVKALKESGAAAAAPAVAGGAAPTPVAAPAAAAAAPAPAGGEPQPGVDYAVIEITDDMAADEVRKARIANAKARSAAMKAWKEAGGGSQPAAAPAPPAPTPAPAAAPAPQPAAAATPSHVPPAPDYIEITDDMGADDVRKARIANAKMRSAYAKELKAAGIDPSTVL